MRGGKLPLNVGRNVGMGDQYTKNYEFTQPIFRKLFGVRSRRMYVSSFCPVNIVKVSFPKESDTLLHYCIKCLIGSFAVISRCYRCH